ncbi:hypothetical protein D9M70_620980 [compost metagenome]
MLPVTAATAGVPAVPVVEVAPAPNTVAASAPPTVMAVPVNRFVASVSVRVITPAFSDARMLVTPPVAN